MAVAPSDVRKAFGTKKRNKDDGNSKPLKIRATEDYSENMNTVIQPDTAKKISLTPAPWTMHEFFAGSGLVAYGLKGMFRPVWSNDICPKKAAVYKANFESNHFENVIGLLSANEGANYAKLHNALLELGYKSGAIVLDAALFVPQSRPRVFNEFN